METPEGKSDKPQMATDGTFIPLKLDIIRSCLNMLLSKFARVFVYSLLIIFLTTTLVKAVYAQPTTVFLDPPSQTVDAVGDTFNVNVNIANVSDLYAYEFTVFYDSALMKANQATQGSFLPSAESTFIPSIVDNYNSTNGAVEIICTLLGNVSGISGSGVLATIEFNSLAVANSTSLHLASVQLTSGPPNPYLIPSEDSDGTVTVVPEFASLAAFFALITASLVGILIGKVAERKVKHFNS